jgi:16S rRNA (guanine966-N2)-methyltransferase
MYILAGTKKGMRLKVPQEGTRPTTNKIKKSRFDSVQYLIEGAEVLDLFAGSGSLGLEALSRGARTATFVEKNASAIDCIKKNVEILGFNPQVTIIPSPVERALNHLKEYDLIFIDPPYDMNIKTLVQDIRSHLKDGGLMIVEQSKRTKFLDDLLFNKKKECGDTVNYFFQKNDPKI